MLARTLAIFATVSAVLGSSEIPRRAISQCSGTPGGVFYNDTSLTDTPTKVVYSYQESTILTGVFYYNGHGGAPCLPRFALGITKNDTAPTNVVKSGWVDRVAIGGDTSNALVLDGHIDSGIYNVFLVQYDPANGKVIANPASQSKGKICFRAIYPLTENPCD